MCRIFIPVLLFVVMSGCDSGGPQTDEPDTPTKPDDATVSYAIARSAESSLPDSTTHAFIRLWNNGTGFNSVKYIKIPDLGEQTEVGFNAEDASGYRVGVVGVKRSDGANFVLAGGGTDPFDIEPDSTYQVSVDVKPYALSVQRPDTLQAASSVTFEATLRGFSNIFNRHYLNYTVNEEEVGIYGFGQQESGDFQVLDDSTSQSVVQFTLPELAQDTTLYVRHRWATRTDGSWQTNEGEGLATLDFPSATGVFEIPIAGESGSNVIIVFAKDGTHERTTVE